MDCLAEAFSETRIQDLEVGAIMVLMLWLYITELMVLIGAEVNAVLARAVEEQKDTKIVRPQGSEEQSDTQLNNPTG